MELNEGFIDTSNSLSSWDQETSGVEFFPQTDLETIALDFDSLESVDFDWQLSENTQNLIKTEALEIIPSTPPEQILQIQPMEPYIMNTPPYQYQPIQPVLQPQPIQQVQQQPIQQLQQQDLNLTLYQKRRGTGGLWQPVAQNERIRVDKSKGKLVRLYIKSNKANIGEEDWTFQIILVDKARPEIPIQQGDGFTIEPPRPAKGGIDITAKEFKLKLTKISRNQYFFVTARRGDVQLTGCTLEFRSDDNGKVLNSKKRPRTETSFTGSSNGVLSCRDLCVDNDLVNLIARSLVPVILDNFQAQLASGNLEDNIAKRIRLAFNPTIKCEAVNC